MSILMSNIISFYFGSVVAFFPLLDYSTSHSDERGQQQKHVLLIT